MFGTYTADALKTVSKRRTKRAIDLLEKQTKGTVELIEEVKAELVGGFVLNYDDYKYDASIAYQLKKLKKSTAEINLYIREL